MAMMPIMSKFMSRLSVSVYKSNPVSILAPVPAINWIEEFILIYRPLFSLVNLELTKAIPEIYRAVENVKNKVEAI